MKVLVCGGRDYSNAELLHAVLDEIHAKTPITKVIQGGASGADDLAFDWALKTAHVESALTLPIGPRMEGRLVH